MAMPPVFEVLIILLLIAFNGLLSLAEIAVISARRARLQHRAQEGDLKARAALELANAPNQFLSTVQLGITLVSILAGAFGGATLSQELAARISQLPVLAPYGEAIGLGLVVLTITYLSVVLGELVPKRLALTHPEAIASAIAGPMHALARLAFPAVCLLSRSTDCVLRLLRTRPSTEPPVTDEEIALLIAQGTEAGVFQEAEKDIVKSVFRLADQRVSAIMTPRTEIEWVDVEDAPLEIELQITRSTPSWMPVGEGSIDRILGVVRARELLSHRLTNQTLDVRATLHKPLFVPESMPALRLLELFKQSGIGLALVIDEYGGTQGLVTLTDILEAIVGAVPLAGEQPEPAAVRREDGSWLIDGMLQVKEFDDLFHIRALPSEVNDAVHTVGGFAMTHLGHVPAPGEHFVHEGLRFEVLDMDGNRIDKVLVSPITPT